jgi:hypothetical protein
VDGDVDLDDYGSFESCLAGPASDPPADCAAADLDEGGTVDLYDFGLFQLALPGA